ncbi:menaquinone-dependent protoporphyrinogen IX dehydrogenase [Lutibacter sp. HS1-25]|uniref:menaquinone-dependent protoporphyrinogen IX dehydrogenase n=1 Tax=Lutibacter sp. HS1-25 TaxID=2485000 RepID=UPI0010106214|nr:menaquinone-dependent protoporphyrinogen IX dehydrogenase [Lutibacter sp. HS1-25]RXP54277.1 menaquinone-dependent protoporphyrinogen IX dehydrogenase [Lutibacter sp. HS1-25]
MTKKTALIYATVDGQTFKICNEIETVFKKNNLIIDVFSIDEFKGEISNYDAFVIGSSIRYGVHNEKIIEFIKVNKQQLEQTKTAFFSVNLVARKPEKNKADTNPYVVKFFKKIDWKPTIVEVFAGMLDYKKYNTFDRIMIQFIMWMTKGPTDKNTKIEYTNWEQVNAFGEQLCEL